MCVSYSIRNHGFIHLGKGRTLKDPTLNFYESLASDYRLIYEDWDRSVSRQGEVLDRLIRSILSRGPLSLLDCSCGIGTQAIGLAKRGYRVRATDLSPRSIVQARKEAKRLKAKLTFGVADLRELGRQVPGRFDAVLSCDNALPHLLTGADLSKALRNMGEKLAPGGLLLLSLRDYDVLLRTKPSFTPPVVRGKGRDKSVYFQIWDWEKGGLVYKMHLFLIRQSRGKWEQRSFTTRYRALRRKELTALLRKAGFGDIRWHEPSKSGYYQPIVTAKKAI